MSVKRSPTRLIARLDVKGPNLIKGIQFDGHRVVGVPEQFAEVYYREGIDEIIFQDTVASLYQRNSLYDIISRTAERVFIPITVAGGLRSVEDMRKCLRSGADKVAINTAAVTNPDILKEAVDIFGSQCIVASLEVYRYESGRCEIWTDYGRQETGIDAFEWAEKVVKLGVGEIMLTSINREGTGRGFDTDLIRKMSDAVNVPVIAIGGAGNAEDVVTAIKEGHADAVGVASILHYKYAKPIGNLNMQFNEKRLRMGQHIDSGNAEFISWGYGGQNTIPVKPVTIGEIKNCMSNAGVNVRKIDLPEGSIATELSKSKSQFLKKLPPINK